MPPEVCPTCRGQRATLVRPVRFAAGPADWHVCATCGGQGWVKDEPEEEPC